MTAVALNFSQRIMQYLLCTYKWNWLMVFPVCCYFPYNHPSILNRIVALYRNYKQRKFEKKAKKKTFHEYLIVTRGSRKFNKFNHMMQETWQNMYVQRRIELWTVDRILWLNRMRMWIEKSQTEHNTTKENNGCGYCSTNRCYKMPR